MENIVFVLLSIIAVGGAAAVVSLRNPVYAAMSMMLFFLSLSGLYVLLSAPFLAAVQVIVYVGAILVLFLFVIMLLDLRTEDSELRRNPLAAAGVGAMLGATGLLALVPVVARLRLAEGTREFGPVADGFGSTAHFAEAAFGRYALPIEIVSVLIVAAIVGAVAMAQKRLDQDSEGEAQ